MAYVVALALRPQNGDPWTDHPHKSQEFLSFPLAALAVITFANGRCFRLTHVLFRTVTRNFAGQDTSQKGEEEERMRKLRNWQRRRRRSRTRGRREKRKRR